MDFFEPSDSVMESDERLCFVGVKMFYAAYGLDKLIAGVVLAVGMRLP